MSRLILVTGATGGTGSAVVRQLLRRGDRVRAGSREPSRHRFPEGVEPVELDLEDVATVLLATAGVDAIIAAHGGDPGLGATKFERVDYQGTLNLLNAAPADIPLIYVSSIYTGRERPPVVEAGDPFRWKGEVEASIRSSGRPYVIVRPSWLTNGPGGVAGIRAEQGDTGDGSISREDVAAVLVAALDQPVALGKTFELYADEMPPPGDWQGFFAPLIADPLEHR